MNFIPKLPSLVLPQNRTARTLLASFISVLMLFAGLSVATPANADPVPGVALETFTYTTDENNVTITGCVDTCPAALVIPSTLGGNPVTAIGYEAFYSKGLTSVTLPASLNTIDFGAFFENQLTSIAIPNSVTSIGESAFKYNSLTSVTIPSSVVSIGMQAFALNSLTSFGFAGNAPVEETDYVLYGNIDLEFVDVAYGSTGWGQTWSNIQISVGDAPFTYTTDSENKVTVTGYQGTIPSDLVIPNTLGGNPVTVIAASAFEDKFLSSLSLPSSLTTIGKYAFSKSLFTELSLPDSLSVIGAFAFSGNSLDSVLFPASITSVDYAAFSDNELTYVNFSGDAPFDGGDVFYNNLGLSAIDVNSGTTGWGSTFSGVTVRGATAPEVFTYTTDSSNNVTVTGCVGSCPADLVIPETLGGNPVTTIGDYAFLGKSLISVTIPNSVTNIGTQAFVVNSLISLTIPASVTSIGYGAFAVNSLTSVIFDGNAPSSGGNEFGGSSDLAAVDVSYGSTGWGSTFSGVTVRVAAAPEIFTYTTDSDNNVTITGCVVACPSDLVIPEMRGGNPVTAIFDFAFFGASLASVQLPGSIVSIGHSAFRANTLSSIDLPQGLTSIGAAAFNDNALVSVKIPSSVTTLGASAFRANSLTSFVFKGNAPAEASTVFYGNSGLTAVDVSYGSTGWDSTYSGVTVRVGPAPEVFNYTTDSSNNVTVTGCFGTCPVDLVIPATLGGNPVTAIGDSAFFWKNLTSVIIPDSVTSIGDNAFYTNLLASVTIPDSVTSIGDYAFMYNQFTSVTIPDSVTSIGGAAFMYNQLTSATIGNSVTSIGDSAFSSNQLTSITIPDSVTNLGGGAFYNNKLTSATIPDSLTRIAEYVFAYNLLTSVTIPSSVTEIAHYAFGTNLLTSVTFAGGAPTDGGLIFGDNESLSAVDVSYGATGWGETFSDIAVRVGEAPFTYTTDSSNNVTVTGCVGSCPADLVIPNTLGGNPVTAIADWAFDYSGLTSIAIPDSVTVIGGWAFEGNNFTTVSLPSHLITIGHSAFYGNDLTSIDFPDTLTTLGGYAFAANKLTSLTVPASVTTLEDAVFYGNMLTSATFLGDKPGSGADSGVNQLGGNPSLTFVDVIQGKTGWGSTFSGVTVRVGAAPEVFTYTTDSNNNVTVTGCIGSCPADLVIPSTLGGNPVTAIGDNAFKGAGLTSVALPDSLVSIGYWAFENNSLASVTLPDSLTTLNAGAFYINSLVSVEVPSSVTTVGDYAFAKNSLTTITFKGNAPAEAGSVFENNADLATVDVAFGSTGWGATFNGMTVRVGDAPFTYTVDENNNVTVDGYLGDTPVDLVIPATLGGNPVTSIYEFAFAGRDLTSLTLPNTITSIGDGAFSSNSLTSLTLPASVTSIGWKTFAYNQLTNVTIPASVTSLGDTVFGWNSLTSVTFDGNAPAAGITLFKGNANLAAIDVSYGTTGWAATFTDVSVHVVGAPAGKPATAPKIRSAKVGNGQVTLGIWAPRKNGGSEITGYEYTVDDGTTWAAVDASSTALSLVITGLDNATRYTVKVRAVTGAGGGAASSAKSFTPRTVAGAPIITSLTGLSAKIKVDIEAPAFNGGSKITRYAYSINEGTWHSWNAGGTGTPQFITGLKAGVSCSVRLRAYTAAGWGAISEAAIATPTRK